MDRNSIQNESDIYTYFLKDRYLLEKNQIYTIPLLA